MTSDSTALQPEVPEQNNDPDRTVSLFAKIKEHGELIAALVSGAIILSAWMMGDQLSQTLWVNLHLTAFVIGGYAKAKEGITDTIRTKELNVEMLMIFAAIGSAAIGYWTEGAILIFIFALSGALETYTMNKSNKEIASLMDLQPEEAVLLKGGEESIVPVKELAVDDVIFVRAGERIPADGQIIKGATSVDESAITGESMPVRKANKEDVYAGTVALDGSITVSITTKPDDTLFQKIIQMVQNAQDEKSPSQLFIEKFEGKYVKAVLAAVALTMVMPALLFGWSWSDSIYRAMILLVVASPCALVASIMPATLSAISNSARSGVLFKGGVHLENLGHVHAIAFDKTGTLTNGKPVVTDAYFNKDFDRHKVISIVAAIEKESTHPLAAALTSYGEDVLSAAPKMDVHHMTTVSGQGVFAYIDGQKWEIGGPGFIGKELVENFQDGIAADLASEGKTVVLAKTGNRIAGVFALKDTVRNTTKRAIKQLKEQGIHTIMLTGDNEITARAVAEEVGVDRYISNCLPGEKVEHVKELMDEYGNVAMVGDGINDAPALATANIGVAMGEGTDVALETSDMVLMKNDLSRITGATSLSSRMNRVIKQNIVFSIAVIVVLIFSNFFQVIDLPLGVIGHEGSTILVILNGLRLLQ
ncbi:heavy metal translocating P-type ATPase [Virgibacillus xinjiangensis]|uniref:Heavy metal translocating P-type ATPase n=1 Tax=Virgibacillus xinjiangensis TaxID=393090 RepID=A0ABV7CZ13_9BACI